MDTIKAFAAKAVTIPSIYLVEATEAYLLNKHGCNIFLACLLDPSCWQGAISLAKYLATTQPILPYEGHSCVCASSEPFQSMSHWFFVPSFCKNSSLQIKIWSLETWGLKWPWHRTNTPNFTRIRVLNFIVIHIYFY